MSDQPTVWVSLDDAAKHVKLSIATIRRAALRGDLKAYKVGAGKKLWRFRLQDLDEWLMSSAVPVAFQPKRKPE